MDNAVPAGQSGAPDTMAGGVSPAPPMPTIRLSEQYIGPPHPLMDGRARIVGWQWQTTAKGGPCFATLWRTAMGSYKILERFPLTPEGWVRAWDTLVKLDANSAEKARMELAERQRRDAELGYSKPAELAELDARMRRLYSK